eukprot:4714282-Amphidinium_carterae.1
MHKAHSYMRLSSLASLESQSSARIVVVPYQWRRLAPLLSDLLAALPSFWARKTCAMMPETVGGVLLAAPSFAP